MHRHELIVLLADLVQHKRLTEEEAARVLAAFDDGDLDVLRTLPPAQSDEHDWLAALVLLLLLMGGAANMRLSVSRRQRARRLLRSAFDATVGRLAAQVTAGALTVSAWQAQMQAATATYARQMATAGAGQLPSAATRQMVDERLAAQDGYLTRFGVTVAARQKVERPLSTENIAARSAQYGAVAWAAYWAAQGQDAGNGVVEQWISRDDNHTCPQCAGRNGQYFLPGQGPMPGVDCDGGGHCRCERVQVVDMNIYQQLRGVYAQLRRVPTGATP